MDTQHIDILFVDEWNSDEIVALYQAGGWWDPGTDTCIIPLLIKNSFAFTVAVNTSTNKAVGMGRILSDGVSDAYIQDVVVLKDYRGYGIGRMIIEHLLSYCQQRNVPWIALISEPGQDGFYKPLGFKEMKQYVPMKYESKN